MISQKKTEEHPFADIFDEDETEKDFLLSKPVCFIIFGKPVITTQEWKPNTLPILEEMIATESESGAMLRSMLISGNSIPDELVTKLMLEKLNSSEVSHFGYIVTEIPSLSEDAMTVLQQVELIKNLKLKPDIIINIRCPDYDICQRISGQRQHCNTGYVYTRDQWDPEVIESRRKKKKDTHKEGKTEEEGEEEEEQEEEEAFIAEMQMAAEILHHLVQRPEDYLENVENIIQLYKETILNCLEEVMAEHNPQFLIELDGNKPPEELFMTVIERLKYLNLKRAAVVTKLQSSEEEMNDITETDELFHTLSAYKLIAPRYRWRRSKWGHTCPVALKEGNIYSGLPDFSVSFLGKIYCLSSEETLKTFLLNPRPFLLPPMPIPPCKIFIFGPQYSGKTTLSHLIANYYKGKVIDYTTVVQPIFDAARESLIENSIAEATEAAIKVVKENLLAELQAKRQGEPSFLNVHFNRLADKISYSFVAAHRQESQTSTSLEDTEEAKRNNNNHVSFFTKSTNGFNLLTYFTSFTIEDSIEEVTADHPAVISMLEESLKATSDMNFENPYEKHAEILEEILKEVMEENKDRFSGAPQNGGWILGNCPLVKELWIALIDKGILPDLVILLSDTENNGKCLLNRIYLRHKSEINAKILERLLDELQKKKQEEAAERRAKEEEFRIEEEKQRLLEAINKKAKGKHRLI
uniref:Uncharacterized protein n=1 Tax=Spermophilus dauricus TaxID=99837 RepID=A0A8C9QFC0_SPEDA